MLMLDIFYFSFYFKCLSQFNELIMVHLEINHILPANYQLYR